MEHLIIGNSIAATHAISAIRSHQDDSTITVIERQKGPIYSPPLLSYWLEGKLPDEKLAYRSEVFYKNNGVRILNSVEATAIDPEARVVEISPGGALSYDRLLIACGGEPIVPPVSGLNADNYLGFTRIGDVHQIRQKAESGKRALIVGGGLIGLKAAEALRRIGLEVTVLELAGHILASILPHSEAGLIQSRMEQAGITFFLENTVEQIEERSDGQLSVHLKSGGLLQTDLLIVAIGVRPALDLASGAGIATKRGILVDSMMQTSRKNIYAAGDVAEEKDLITGQSKLCAILPDAARQGTIAGYNMAGVETRSPGGLSWNSLHLFDCTVMTAGCTQNPNGEFVKTEIITGSQNRRIIYWQDTIPVGAILINDCEGAGLIRDLIAAHSPVPFKEQLEEGLENLTDLPQELWEKHLTA